MTSTPITINNIIPKAEFIKNQSNYTIQERLTSVRDIYAHRARMDKVISLAEGGCFMPTPIPVLKKLATSAMNISGIPHQIYPANNASGNFLNAIWNYFSKDCEINLNENEDGIIYAYGASHVFDVFLSAVCSSGDYILMPESYYHAYVEWPEKWGGKAVRVQTSVDNGFKLTAKDLETWLKNNAVNARKAKCVVITSPTSTGAVYSEAELLALSEVVKKRGMLIFSDEVYKDAVHPGKKSISTASIKELKPFTVTANSGSKTKSVANLRIGWGCGPKSIIEKMIWNLEYTLIDVPLYLQDVGESILKDVGPEFLSEAADEYAQRLDLILNLVDHSNMRLNVFYDTSDIAYIKTPFIPEAGYSICLDFNEFENRIDRKNVPIKSGQDLCRHFCEHRYTDATGKEFDQGLILSSGFSKGHDDFSMYAVFGQAGYEYANQIQQPYLNEQIASAFCSSPEEPSTPPDMGPAKFAGRQMIIEAFDRIVEALKELRIDDTRHNI